jgi:hypothetical protein
MTPADPLAGKSPTPKPPVVLDRFARIIRAARVKPAGIPEEGRNAHLVEPMHERHEPFR